MYILSQNSSRRELCLFKAAEIHVFKMSESSKLFQFPLRLIALPLKLAAIEDIYLPPVVNEANKGRILNTNQLHNVEQRLNTNHFFYRK